ncbi:sulfatase-like hydrolase/transferase [Variovorax sp. J22R24]|uniref:sulfatase-like hydrolase/transferase n=1 Tax=Variovorax gracilis TaxID=3053502 RepID=UPI002575B579|nr:sulfatase-like hydrolase/transferase [Variovorax sp. J22R24]MDM0109164.1 sulfatase-like hydrolase/transferase [Variovorax sp. J22R24]
MPRRNVIVIMSDEHDPRIMRCAGHPIAKTPNLDALAARGTRFANAYTPSPICVPARAAFATGLRVHQTRHWDNAMPYVGDPRGWGHVLQREGIRVESIGKLHYRAEEDPAGFDKEHIPMHVVGGHGMVWASIRDPYVSSPSDKRMLGERVGAGESPYTDYDREVTARAVDWIRDAGTRVDESFVLYVGLVAPHFPLIAPQEFFSLYPLEGLPTPKLHPSDGYERHPWVQAYADFMKNEEQFKSPQERLEAFAAYYGLCSFLDYNVGQITLALRDAGLEGETTVVYTSDHGDNLGTRGLWGKSTLYQESVCVPMIVAGPGIEPGVCRTPVDLLDLYPTILQGVGLDPAPDMADRPGQSLYELAAATDRPERVVFSEYHAAGSNTAGFMVRKGRWKFHYYVRFRPELFDLDADPEELCDLASDPRHAAVVAEMEAELRCICDPEAVDALAKSDQRAMIERLGGVQAAATMGAGGATPVPKGTPSKSTPPLAAKAA